MLSLWSPSLGRGETSVVALVSFASGLQARFIKIQIIYITCVGTCENKKRASNPLEVEFRRL